MTHQFAIQFGLWAFGIAMLAILCFAVWWNDEIHH